MTQTRRLSIVLALNIAMIAGLVIVGLSSHSLGVLAAGGDYAADSVAIILGLAAIYIRDKNGKSMATTYVAAINATFLLLVTGVVSGQAIHRLTSQTPEIQGLQSMIVSIFATVAMVIGALIISGDKAKEDLHMRSVLLDTISDGTSAAAVAVTGGIIYFTHHYYWLDSAVALVISVLIGFTAIKLLTDVSAAIRSNRLKS